MRKEKSLAFRRVFMVPILAIVLSHMGVGAPSGESSKENPEGSSGKKSVRDAIVASRNLTPEQVASLEEKLANDPNDVAVRTQLLAYYGGVRSFRNQSAKESKREHALWFIRNSPESEILGMPPSQINHVLDRDGYAEAKEAWMSQIDREPENATLLGHAAGRFLHVWGSQDLHQIAPAGSFARSLQPGMAE